MLRYWFSVQSESLPPGVPADSQSVSLPSGALADSQSESLPPGALADSQSESLPLGALADSQSESLPPGVPADLQSAVKKCSTTFPLGICNPHPLSLYFILKQSQERLALADSQSESLPPGALADSQSESLPSGVPADLQSAVKKCSTTFPWGFAIPILFICISF